MTSERQRTANRANARRSTGPRTPNGKMAVRLNALGHGLFARDVVLPEEDADAFEDLWNQVRANLSPVGPIEEFLVDCVVNAMWRLRRSARAETALFYWRVQGLKADRLANEVNSHSKVQFRGRDIVDQTSHSVIVTNKAAYSEASEAFEQAKCERDRDEVLVGRAVDADAKEADAFAKLARYETSLQRSLYGTLDELRQVQNERQNRPSSPILDVVALNAGGNE
jgi:hypothetical protein